MLGNILGFDASAIVQILQVGIAGFVFLMVAMTYRLIRAEQKKVEPSKQILAAVDKFKRHTLSMGILVAAATVAQWFIGDRKQTLANDISGGEENMRGWAANSTSPYYSDYSSFVLDLSGWKSVPPNSKANEDSLAKVTRADMIRKVRKSGEDYVVPSWTTGRAIKPLFLRSPYPPVFEEVSQKDGKQCYQLTLPLGQVPEGSFFPLATVFEFANGFQKETGEDWRASIRVPTGFIAVSIRFPKEKRVTVDSVKVSLVDESGNKLKNLSELNPAIYSESDGHQMATWSGTQIPEKHSVLFEWDWTSASTSP